MLKSHYYEGLIEAGCDEAGRGCLAGSVYAAAVILPSDYQNELLNDSKKLTAKKRYALRGEIERDAIAWAVGIVTPEEIDKINILNASFLAMHRALDQLQVRPEAVIVDGNRFKPYQDLPSTTIVKGDGKYLSIAAAQSLPRLIVMTICSPWLRNIRSMTGSQIWVIQRRSIVRLFVNMVSHLIIAKVITFWVMGSSLLTSKPN